MSKKTQCEIICLNCSKKFYVKNYRKDDAKYCSRKCRKDYFYKHKRINKCDYCLKEFIKLHNCHREYKFCSNKCCGKYSSIKSKVENICECCNKVFLIGSHYKNQKCCSKECGIKIRTTKVDKICLICNNIFSVSFNRKNKASYCSYKCRGISMRKYGEDLDSIRKSPEYKAWRKTVLIRDDYTCVFCNKRGGKLHVDHIKQFAFYPDLRFDINNGRVLCVTCHKKTDTYGNRKFDVLAVGSGT